MKQVFSSTCPIAALIFIFGAFSYTLAQTPSATPDPFVVQLTSSPTGFGSFGGDITANGRFVVFESNGDVATENPNNADGNREIFLADYAQRRIFQITNTKNVQKVPASPTPTPTPSASPTPTPAPTPADPAQIQIEISNNHPIISSEPQLVAGKRVYTIVFSSNAPNPAGFDGTDSAALDADGNQEIWIYRLPAVADVTDLSSGDDLPLQNLSLGTFQQITNTPASRPIITGKNPPDAVDDNRESTISDDGNTVAFISTANLVPGVGNADRNPELFFWTPSGITQATKTQDAVAGVGRVFQQNPSLSANGSVVAFLSSANLTGNNDDGNGRGNGEVYVATFSGSGLSNIRQVTRTKIETSGSNTGATVNLLSPGRCLSRDGSLIAFESRAEDPKANSATNNSFLAVFVYNVAGDSFAQIGPRPVAPVGDIINFPTFTDYNDPLSPLSPGTLIFSSAENLKTDGTFPAADQASTGLNPSNQPQIFATQVSASPARTFTRLTNNPVGAFGGMRALTSKTQTRIAFSLGGSELGGGNADNSTELFYLLTPRVTSDSAAGLSFFTGASEIPLPNPSPSPSPLVGTVTGLAPGELAVTRSTVDTVEFAPAELNSTGGSETKRSPALPVELGGVSVSVNGAAAGLYYVFKQINFVVPIGVAAGTAPVAVVKADGTKFRGSVLIVPTQPDIFTLPGNRARVVNVTNPLARIDEGSGFNVTSTDSAGNTVATVLEISLTGVRFAAASEVKVTIVTASGNTDITGDSIVLVSPNKEMPGWDVINFKLPSTLAGAGDVKLIVTVTKSGTAFSSRPADTAPVFRIN